jgi:hypothetical protein
MNIFFSSKNPVNCAKYLDDRRVNKMCLETTQMLCTALYITNPDQFVICEYSPLVPVKVNRKFHSWDSKVKVKKAIYKGGIKIYAPTHKNHPSNVWARASRNNWFWLWVHGKSLCREYTRRYGKVHKCQGILESIFHMRHIIPRGAITPFANCAANQSIGVSYKHMDDVTTAYQLYLSDRWDNDKRTPTWYGVGR